MTRKFVPKNIFRTHRHKVAEFLLEHRSHRLKGLFSFTLVIDIPKIPKSVVEIIKETDVYELSEMNHTNNMRQLSNTSVSIILFTEKHEEICLYEKFDELTLITNILKIEQFLNLYELEFD